MAEDPNKAQEEARKKQEEQRRLQEEAKTRQSNLQTAERTRQQAVEKSSKKSVVEAPGGSNDIAGEAMAQNRAVGEPSRGEKPQTARGNEKGYGYDTKGNYDPMRAKKEYLQDQKNNLRLEAFSSDPYATSIFGRSFKQATPEQRNRGEMSEADQAREIRSAGEKNLRTDIDYISQKFGHEVKSGLDRSSQYYNVIKSLEKETGVKAESTGGLGQYNARDMAKYMSNPEVKSFVDQAKTGQLDITPVEKLSLREQAIQDAVANKERLANYKTDFQKDVENYQARKASGLVDTTKGPRLDTTRQTRQTTDPLKPMGGQIMGGIPKFGGGVYGPGGYGAENVMTNRPAKTQQELEQRMAKFNQAHPLSDQNIASTAQKIVNRRAGLTDDGRAKGAYLPGGQFIASKPQPGMETDEQRMARREKELGIGRFANKPSYFDDKSRGRRII